MRLLALVVVAGGVLALGPISGLATADGATVFVHSAKSGAVRGGRLTLRGVGRIVTWTSNRGHSGVVSIKRLHRRVFAPGTPPATGTLHVDGRRPGEERAFQLSRPRYDASRQTVSYRVERLGRAARAAKVGSAAQASDTFGAASLSIVGAPAVVGNTFGGNDCTTTLENQTGWDVQAIGSSNWPTDTWDPGIPPGYILSGEQRPQLTWESDGGFFRGCSASAVWQFVDEFIGPDHSPSGTFALTTTYTWNGTPSYSCVSSNPRYECSGGGQDSGSATWIIGLS